MGINESSVFFISQTTTSRRLFQSYDINPVTLTLIPLSSFPEYSNNPSELSKILQTSLDQSVATGTLNNYFISSLKQANVSISLYPSVSSVISYDITNKPSISPTPTPDINVKSSANASSVSLGLIVGISVSGILIIAIIGFSIRHFSTKKLMEQAQQKQKQNSYIPGSDNPRRDVNRDTLFKLLVASLTSDLEKNQCTTEHKLDETDGLSNSKYSFLKGNANENNKKAANNNNYNKFMTDRVCVEGIEQFYKNNKSGELDDIKFSSKV